MYHFASVFYYCCDKEYFQARTKSLLEEGPSWKATITRFASRVWNQGLNHFATYFTRDDSTRFIKFQEFIHNIAPLFAEFTVPQAVVSN